MTRTYVAINDPVHDVVRTATRRTPLKASLSAGGRLRLEYEARPEDLPETFWGLAWLHALKGSPAQKALNARGRPPLAQRLRILEQVSHFDVIKLDRRCARDLRLKSTHPGPGMLGCELLCFGVGMLRARNDNPRDRLHHLLWKHYGRITPKNEIVFATIRTLAAVPSPGSLESHKEAYDSTNVYYGDVLGELQQIWDRRADTNFLEQVVLSLQSFGAESGVASFLRPPQCLAETVRLHLRAQSVWRKPPTHARAVLRRVEYILDHTQVDAAPETCYRGADTDSHAGHSPGEGWQDRLGYDGWL